MQETTPHQRLKKRLESIGIQVTITHNPLHYSLRYAFVKAESDDPSEVLFQFLSELIKYVPVEKALEQEAKQEKPETSYLDDPTRVEPGWLGTYDEGQKIAEYNKEMDERNRIIRESVEKPWLPLHDGE